MAQLAQQVAGPTVDHPLARMQGMVFVLVAAVLWGLSGTASQELFQHDGVGTAWLVAVRMTVSGILLLGVVIARRGVTATTAVWRSWRSARRMLVFSIVGLMGVQYAYLAAIAHSNAATATLLQYLGPVVIVLYLTVANRRWPTGGEQIAVVLAIAGTYLLVTNGHWGGLEVSLPGLLWGLGSAFALAFYTLHPKSLLQRYGSATVVGWALTIGGFIMCVYARVWDVQSRVWTSNSALWLITFVTLGGTLLAFYLYLASLRWLTAAQTSLFACAEPLSAAIAAMLLLHVHMGAASLVGALCILTTILVLARQTRETG